MDEAAGGGLDEALAGGRRIGRLVNNVGHVKPATVEEQRLEDFDAVMRLNVRVAMQIGQALIPGMRHLGGEADRLDFQPCGFGKELRTAYAASKSALHGLTKTWALELAKDGITVNCVAPGSIDTPLWRAVNPPGSPDPEDHRRHSGGPFGHARRYRERGFVPAR